MKRRILPMIMAIMMILSIIQMPAWAATGDDPTGTDESIELADVGGDDSNEGEPETQDGNDVAQIGDTGYSTLQAAIDAIENEGIITLLTDVSGTQISEYKQMRFYDANKTITIDLKGKTITASATEAINIHAPGLTLTIKNGTIINRTEGDYSDGIYAFYDSSDEQHQSNNLNLTLENIKLDSRTQAIAVQGNTTNSNVTLDNCVVTSDTLGIYYPPKSGTLSISDTSITAPTGVVIKGSSVEISGNTHISATGKKVDPDDYYHGDPNSSLTLTGDAIYVESGYNDRDISLKITGGTFESENGDAVRMYIKAEEVTPVERDISISGGTFSSDVSEYLDPSCNMKQSGDNWVVTPLTKEDATASVGGKYYRSLSAAIAAAGDGDTVTLLEDTKEDIVIPKDAELTLDLNGRTLTNVSGHTITNNGTLTITGDGTVDNVTHGKAALVNYGTAVVENVTLKRSQEAGTDADNNGGNSYYTLENYGVMTIEDGTTVENKGAYSSMVHNGWADGSKNTDRKNSVLTINGGTFNGGLNTIKNDDYGELTINDGTFENMSQATFLNWNIATVNGGTFNAESASSGVILNGYLDDSKDQGELTINGGTFNAGDSNTVITTMGGAKHSGDIEITGGTLSGSIVLTDSKDGAQLTITQDAKINGNVTNSGKADVAITDGATVSGQVSNDTDGTMSVVNSTVGSVPEGTTAETIVIVNSTVDGTLTTNTAENAAVMVGGKTYDTLAEAIKAVGNGQTIYVLKDIPDAVGIAVPSSKNFTIDFGGHTYTLIGPGAGSSGTETNGFQLLKDSTITLKNGTIRIAEGANNIKRIIQNYANLTLEDMHIYAQNQQPDENYALSFNNGDITFKGDTDVITSSDDVIAFDICKFSNYPSASVTFDESYTGTINGKIVYDSDNAEKHKLTIQGNGTFGTIEAASGAGEAAKAGIEVTSGHFAEPVNEDYLADSVKAQLESASNPEAPYSYYPSVENAIAAAKPGDTVTAVNTKPGKTTYTVTLKFNDGRTDNLTYEVSEGTAIDLPTPSRSGYTFEGWYDGNTRVSDPYNVTKTVTLTAGWDYKDDDHGSSSSGSSSSVRRYDIEADAGRGGDISPDGRVRVRRGENQTFRITADDGYEIYDVEVDGESVGAVSRYTFENVREDHTISATFRQTGAQTEEAQLPFLDVAEGAWYYDAVTYCYENGIMDGTSSVSFAPGMLLNRAMAAQVLYNLADGTASTAAGFPDVAASAWYADAVNWAAANGYVTGYDNGSFGPEDSLTREQLAVILYRYAGSPEPTGSLDGFTDAASTSDYAVDALRWAVGEGLLTGKDGGRLDPAGTASRAELAQILARFAQM